MLTQNVPFLFLLVGQVLLIMYTLKVLLLPFNYCGSFLIFSYFVFKCSLEAYNGNTVFFFFHFS
jgi:hypothetical protein